jgi:hypothetical protein
VGCGRRGVRPGPEPRPSTARGLRGLEQARRRLRDLDPALRDRREPERSEGAGQKGRR